MQFLRLLVIGITAAGTIGVGAATFANWGVPSINQPQGIQMRQESIRKTRAGLIAGRSLRRSHRGGGLSGGK